MAAVSASLNPSTALVVDQNYLEGVESLITSCFQTHIKKLGIEDSEKEKQALKLSAIAIEATKYLDDTAQSGVNYMYQTGMQRMEALRQQGYAVFAHGLRLSNAFYQDMITLIEDGNSSTWGNKFRHFRVPGCSDSMPAIAKEFLASLTNFIDLLPEVRKAVISCDPEMGDSTGDGDVRSYFQSITDRGDTLKSIGVIEESIIDDLAQHYLPSQKEEAAKVAFSYRSKALKDLDRISGKLILIAVRMDVIKNSDQNFVYRAHPGGTPCAIFKSMLKSGKDASIGLQLRSDGTLPKCNCSYSRQVRILTRALGNKQLREQDTIIYSLDSMTYSQRKAYEAACKEGAQKFKEMAAKK